MLGVKGCSNYPMYVRKELKKVLEVKIASKKPPIIGVEFLSSMKEKRKEKIVMSGVGSSSSTVKKVVDCGKIKVVCLLGLEKNQTLHDILRKRKRERKQQATIANHMKNNKRQF